MIPAQLKARLVLPRGCAHDPSSELKIFENCFIARLGTDPNRRTIALGSCARPAQVLMRSTYSCEILRKKDRGKTCSSARRQSGLRNCERGHVGGEEYTQNQHQQL